MPFGNRLRIIFFGSIQLARAAPPARPTASMI